MDLTEHIEHVRSQGALLAAAARVGDGSEPVAGCPGWSLDDLVRHTGAVHTWAIAALAAAGSPPARDLFASTEAAAPRDHDHLVSWYADAHGRLVDRLETIDPAAPVWAFLPRPPGVPFWGRRQAHETAIHRYDAELAVGRTTGMGTALADDGIDEVLGFIEARIKRLVSAEPVTLGIHAVDTRHHWAMRIGPEGRELVDVAEADATVSGPAVDLYLYLWNRLDDIDSTGDPVVLSLWRELAQIH